MVSSILPIVCAINRSYVFPLAVMLGSLKQTLRPGVRPVLFLIHTGMPESSLAILSSLIETRSVVPDEVQRQSAMGDSHFPPEASFLLLLADVLPRDLERVLFLDADLLVMDDLMELWETPMEDHAIAAAADSAVPLCSSLRGVKGWEGLSIPREAPYFNGGVMLIHLERWRDRDVTRRVHQYFATTREAIDFLHQEALNAVLWNDWKTVDPRWNLLASLAGRSYDRSGSDAWRRPGIVHFAGRMKPWRAPIGGPFAEAYRQALERLPSCLIRPAPALRDRIQSVYDRYFRDVLYPVEQMLWRQRVL